MYYIGVDPGKDGCLAILTDEKGAMPTLVPFDEYAVSEELRKIAGQPAIACLEHVTAMPKQGSVSMFNFGMNFGFWQGLLTAYKIPFELVRPDKWKKEFSITADKNTSIAVCKRLFPSINLRKNDGCKKDHDGMAESALMAVYAKRRLDGGED